MDFHAYYRDVMDNHGVLSLSEERNNLLMWAHYACEHKGLCLGFNWEKTGLPAAREVDYHSVYQSVDIWAYTEDELAEIACFQKSVEWAYEREWRSFSTAKYESYSSFEGSADISAQIQEAEDSGEDWKARTLRGEHTYRRRRSIEDGHRPRAFAKDALEEVIFGARMSAEDAKRHADYIRSFGFKPRFYRVIREPRRYALAVQELPSSTRVAITTSSAMSASGAQAGDASMSS